MKTVKLTMEESVYSNIMFLLNNLKVKGLKIEEIKSYDKDLKNSIENDTKVFSNHSANLIEEWKDEDDIWK